MSTMSEVRSVGNGNYEAAKAMRRTMSNPWLQQEIDRIPRDPFWRAEFCQVVASYAMTRDAGFDPFACDGCGSEVHFKNTIGCFKCVGCDALYDSGNRARIS